MKKTKRTKRTVVSFSAAHVAQNLKNAHRNALNAARGAPSRRVMRSPLKELAKKTKMVATKKTMRTRTRTMTILPDLSPSIKFTSMRSIDFLLGSPSWIVSSGVVPCWEGLRLLEAILELENLPYSCKRSLD